MKIIQNIKFQYKVKLIEDLLENSKYSEVNSNLTEITKKNPIDSYNLLRNFINKILNITSEEKILNDNLVFINSFEVSDTEIITKFINFYLDKVNFPNYEISDYNKELVSTINKIKNEKNITVDDLFQNTLFYQSILTYLKSEKIQFLNNQFAFFSTPSGINFTNTRITKCYFLLIDHPYTSYKMFKSKLKSKNLAMNTFLNSDNEPLKYTFENSILAVTRKNWAVFNNSWSDPNVTNTLRGVILKKTDYFESPDEFFGSIVLHLRQVGFDIPLNYSFISDYLSANVPKKSDMDLDISNHEKKSLKREVESFADDFGYDLS
tara:strand:- start:244 stop:1206 length:963 start_codon:yes stop_codon:yes gene_type:complete